MSQTHRHQSRKAHPDQYSADSGVLSGVFFLVNEMNDREQLELAAKAAGVDLKYDMFGQSENAERVYNYWNPLTGDGDALRLAVKLRIGIEINECSVVASWVDGGYETKDFYEYPDSIQDDDFDIMFVNYDKATRRAIVRAAAEIGRQMQEGGAA